MVARRREVVLRRAAIADGNKCGGRVKGEGLCGKFNSEGLD